MLPSDWSSHVGAGLSLVMRPSFRIRPLEALQPGPAIKLSVTTKLKWRLGETRRTDILLDRQAGLTQIYQATFNAGEGDEELRCNAEFNTSHFYTLCVYDDFQAILIPEKFCDNK